MEQNNNKKITLGTSTSFATLFIIMIILKLVGVISVSWWTVFFLPLGSMIFWWSASGLIGLIWVVLFGMIQTFFSKKPYGN